MNGMIRSTTEKNECGLLPYPVILAATKGDPEAMTMVIRQYASQMDYLAMRKLRDERGNTYYGIDQASKTACRQSSCRLFSPSRSRA